MSKHLSTNPACDCPEDMPEATAALVGGVAHGKILESPPCTSMIILTSDGDGTSSIGELELPVLVESRYVRLLYPDGELSDTFRYVETEAGE